MVRMRVHPALRLMPPVVSAALLTAVLAMGSLNPSPPANINEYFEDVARTIDRMPYRVGNWIGTDLDSAPPQALEMLRPNRVLHRGYLIPNTDDRVRVVVVHCPKVGDMQGHYPPRCYPATGWTEIDRDTITADFADGPHEVSVYRFERVGDLGARIHVTVAVFFTLPTAGKTQQAQAIYADLASVRSASSNRRRTMLGSAQLQIIFDGERSNVDVSQVLGIFAPALDPIIQSVAEGLN